MRVRFIAIFLLLAAATQARPVRDYSLKHWNLRVKAPACEVTYGENAGHKIATVHVPLYENGDFMCVSPSLSLATSGAIINTVKEPLTPPDIK